ncbi:uncharacterized protein [Penaeus vannamei]|uniref:uncharacterized protein isoform X2 n=1 Tax=Penaeus vannamei TaxID=6689 RepID=UPI00387F5DEF
MFTTFGIPQEVQSDRGTNFTSEFFAKVLKELGIKQTLSTAYPESQGARQQSQCYVNIAAPYRLHPTKKQQMKDEVDCLLANGLAIPSHSPWNPGPMTLKGYRLYCRDWARRT